MKGESIATGVGKVKDPFHSKVDGSDGIRALNVNMKLLSVVN